jgi:hypothetical protein
MPLQRMLRKTIHCASLLLDFPHLVRHPLGHLRGAVIHRVGINRANQLARGRAGECVANTRARWDDYGARTCALRPLSLAEKVNGGGGGGAAQRTSREQHPS